MSEGSGNERWMEQLAERAEPVTVPAPSKLKAKLYSQLVQAQAQSTGLATLSQSSQNGFGLCAFERLVEIASLGESVEKRNPGRGATLACSPSQSSTHPSTGGIVLTYNFKIAKQTVTSRLSRRR